MIEFHRAPNGIGTKPVDGHDEHSTSFTDREAGDPPHRISGEGHVERGKGGEYDIIDGNEMIEGPYDPGQQRRMPRVDELKAERTPHIDFGRVLVHIAGVHVEECKGGASQEENKEEKNSPALVLRPLVDDIALSDAPSMPYSGRAIYPSNPVDI